MKKSSSTSAILQGKCPRCRQGKMFPYKVTDLSGFSKMNEKCEKCGLKFEVEPGFFIGAMYVSYAFGVAIMVTVGVALSVLFDPGVWDYLVAVSLITIILLPVTFRYSRILFLHWFGGIDFDPKYSN